MSQAYFDFQQFRVYHDRCAQKVGTDGVVLGCWADILHAQRILDIGTGSGLIALIAAQRCPSAQIVAVDVEISAVEQARENVAASPFADRIVVHHADVRVFGLTNVHSSDDMAAEKEVKFDAVICNPPFYTEDTLPPEDNRALARNASCLPFEDLIKSASRLMSEGATFSVMLPFQCYPEFTALCMAHGLCLKRICHVQTVARKAPKRILITYSNVESEQIERDQLILQEGNKKSDAYLRLAQGFYL